MRRFMRNSTAGIILASIAALCGCAQTVKLTGTGVTPPTPALTLNASTLAFGSVFLNQNATQTLTATSTGTAPVTVSSIAVSGSEFSISAPTLPLTLQPQASAQIQVTFDPTVAGNATGAVTVVSNALTSPVQSVTCSATATNGTVQLSWTAPTGGTDPVVGYNVYRAAANSSIFIQLNSTTIAGVTFADSSVTAGQTYQYYVVSVGQDGALSVPSNTATVAIP
jgi:Abnormal spindle-like microcephaly-assoc'd, ASPM-SPD-2-Hydin/Fibronectin type III domain